MQWESKPHCSNTVHRILALGMCYNEKNAKKLADDEECVTDMLEQSQMIYH
jgi:hypothetical protein